VIWIRGAKLKLLQLHELLLYSILLLVITLLTELQKRICTWKDKCSKIDVKPSSTVMNNHLVEFVTKPLDICRNEPFSSILLCSVGIFGRGISFSFFRADLSATPSFGHIISCCRVSIGISNRICPKNV
jgi:hypothetical protein